MRHALLVTGLAVLSTAAIAVAQNCPPSQMPASPRAVSAGDGLTCQYTQVSWQPVSGQVTYRIWRALNGDLDTTEMIADRFDGTVFYDSDAIPLAPYFYWVQSISAQGCFGELSPGDSGFRSPSSPLLVDDPTDFQANEGQFVQLTVHAMYATHIQWRRDGTLIDDGANFVGTQTGTLTIPAANIECIGSYDVIVSNDCGETISGEALLSVGGYVPCRLCVVDYDSDGGVTLHDLEAFFYDWVDGAGCSDVNHDGGIDGSDMTQFVQDWENGSC